MTPAHIDVLEDAAARFAALHVHANPSTPVPSCPGWTMADLLGHLTDVQTWALSKVVESGSAPPGAAEPAAPADPVDPADRYRAVAAALVAALRERAPDTPCWALYPPDVVGTWARRQAIETTVHLWDAGVATGAAPCLQAGVAADGVAEVVDDLYPRQVRLGRQAALPATVAFAMTDVGRTVTLAGTDGLEAVVTLRASAADTLLVLWSRRRLAEIEHVVEGNGDALRATLRAALVP